MHWSHHTVVRVIYGERTHDEETRVLRCACGDEAIFPFHRKVFLCSFAIYDGKRCYGEECKRLRGDYSDKAIFPFLRKVFYALFA